MDVLYITMLNTNVRKPSEASADERTVLYHMFIGCK